MRKSEQPNPCTFSEEYSEPEKKFLWELHMAVEERYSDCRFGVQELADTFELGRTQLHLKMTELSGYSPGRYIHLVRMGAAKLLLRKEQLPIKCIAWECGFNTYPGFWRAFQKEVGISPSQYRSRFQDLQPSSASWEIPASETAISNIIIVVTSTRWLTKLFNVVFNCIEDDDLTLARLAGELSVGPSQLTKRLKSVLGVTPMKLVLQLRLLYAEELVANESVSIAEVAHQAGFFDQAHFCRAFKAAFRHSPSQYRKMERSLSFFTKLQQAVAEQLKM